jgi:hypothetical protein
MVFDSNQREAPAHGRRFLFAEATKPQSPAYSIQDAAKRASCGAGEIIRLILDKKLQWVGKLASAQGYAAVLVNGDEIKELVREPAPDAATVHELVGRFNTSVRVIKALITGGHFTTVTVRNAINRCPMRAIPSADLAAFMQDFVPLFELSEQLHVHPCVLKARLAEQGVQPALDPKKHYATFYRHADIPSGARQ